jgi:hypothetical protein
MKTIILLVGIIAFVATATSADDINVDTLASYSPVGPAAVPVLSVINNTAQLYDYCKATNYDASLLSAQSDFTSKTVIGFITMAGGGNRINYRILMRVYNYNDSVILEVKPDILFFEEGMSIQAVSKVLLFAIPKTDKPVVMKIEQNTDVGKSFHHGTVSNSTQGKKICAYSLLGRSLLAKNEHAAYRVTIFSGGQDKGKKTILQKTGKNSLLQ